MRRTLALAALAALIPTTPAFPQTSAELQFDAAIEEQLRARSPEVARLWREAAEAGYDEDLGRAAHLYDALLALDPSCAPALWAKGGLEAARGHRDAGVQLARRAYAVEPSPLSTAALATILARGEKGRRPPAGQAAEALELARQAEAELLTRDRRRKGVEGLFVGLALCEAAVAAGDVQTASDVSARLYVEHSTPEVLACASRAMTSRGDTATARQMAGAAQKMAREEIAANRARRGARTRNAPTPRSRTPIARPWTAWGALKTTLLVWIGALVALLACGALLGRAVLRTADELARRRDAPQPGAALRRAYAATLWASCAYYYASIPLLALLTVGVGGGLLYAFFAAGRVPIKLALIIALLTLATLWSILKSLFVRARDEDPGLRLDLRPHPRLRQLLGAVAARIGTRPVDSVYLTPGTDLAVLERGGLGRQLRGSTERCLILGVGVLEGFRIGPFKAVLGHEYGHFSNRDTAGGGFALAARRSLVTLAESLAANGAAVWYNPVWLFLQGFFHVFLLISQGASRLQEVLADRWAVLAYGSRAFEEGLRHVIEQSVRFDAHAARAFADPGRSRAVANLYAPQEPAPAGDTQLERAIRAALTAPPSAYDSHPSPMDRTRWARALGAAGTPGPEDGEPVWSLFADPLAIQVQMTEAVQRLVLAAHTA